MGRNRITRIIAASMTVILIFLMSVPSLANTRALDLPGLSKAAVTRDITGATGGKSGIASDADGSETDGYLVPDEDDMDEEILDEDLGLQAGSRIASASSAEIVYTVDGKEKDSISFYVYRDPATNKAITPDPVRLRITQIAGEEDAGDIMVSVGVPENPEDGLKDRIEIIPPENRYLSNGGAIEYQIRFVVSEAMQEGKENIYNDGSRHFITISWSGGEKSVPVYYGIDGLYSAYSVESIGQYEGGIFTDEDSGVDYRIVGHIKLNETEPSSFTIRHQFGVYTDMMGADEQGNPVPLRITKARLNPDGNFVFSDGSVEITPHMDADGRMSIPLRVKKDVFSNWRTKAVRQNKMRLDFILLTDLVIEYNDGYLAGGSVKPLPLVYAVSYIPESKPGGGGSGGGGGGGGGGSGFGSGTTSTGTVQGGPAVTPRLTYAASEDVGWVFQDGAWYYMDLANQPVTDWLFGPDGRWYFLDANGVMKTGWLQLGQVWYFLNADGAMATGWVQGADGRWYYLLQDGRMGTDMTTPDGYYVDKDGVWVK